jgi:DNA polymerase kappa
MNITEHLQKTGQTPAEAVEEMRAAVKDETGLTVSAGVAANKTLAKVCLSGALAG